MQQIDTRRLIERFYESYQDDLLYSLRRESSLRESRPSDLVPSELQSVRGMLGTGGKVGYIIATCSPVTHAHIELAKQAIDSLRLDLVFFVIWPFHFIPGFHSKPLDGWAKEQRHLDWEHRVAILEHALQEMADTRIRVLGMSRQWYIESQRNFSADDRNSYFWTGTWYVVRKLQWHLRQVVNGDLEFYFVCGADQFNPNIYAFLFDQGTEKVWLDYSITQHLTLHHIYAVPRDGSGGDIERFKVPPGIKAKVIIGAPLQCHSLSATQIRLNQMPPGKGLEDFCPQGAARYIREQHFWGY